MGGKCSACGGEERRIYRVLTFICLRRNYISYDLVHRTFTAQVRDVSTCVGAWVVEGGGKHYVSTCVGARIVEGGGSWEPMNKKAFSSIFTIDTRLHSSNMCHTYCCYAYYFTRFGCNLFTCDMYMCRLRHINESVLSSLKMEGIRLLYFGREI
jgi:hypothetical protein